ncbi:ATP-binding cassette subfamily B protein [Arthrobacter silviterrae]|uniref:ABC transporter ATP-binding protein n=1 Tax=Arthrobacter silviterrae TaxID=2026658 RepID=A0ABX0D6T7_9MICC|nr:MULTISPECIES: ABC transporter ATP-binding protein [Arthrobacter]MCU6480870.1 ABC transporter ATP-binding protein/permease [Arthrobacter sp. A2-55]MDQ0276117.1 ATP-binding cassette subfamily B protein [Arthrobacter silviterrae]NGN82582.1 ABC transporter ATP-binding protein [Arthrobacter silviterrae]
MSMMRGRGGPPQKAAAFGPSLKRILRLMAPDRLRIIWVVFLAAVSVGLSVVAPKVLGHATDLIFNGVVGQMLAKSFPAGTTKAAAVAGLKAHGQGQLADMLSGMGVVPGQGLDLGALGSVLMIVLALYIVAFFFNWSQGYITTGIVQRAMYRLRQQIEDKLDRLPMSHFQQESRGDVLSRVTNDIDNFSQTLNQTLTQLLIAALTVVGVLGMMFSISPLLAGISLLTVPVVAFLTVFIAKRSRVQFGVQWKSTGELNGHVEEMFTGHEIVKAFGQQEAAIEKFRVSNDELYESSAKAQFISGIIMPSMNFVSNLNYVVVAVLGGIQVASGIITIGSVQAFIQYSRQFSQPMAQIGSMINLLQSGVASAERVFDLIDAQEQTPDHVPAAKPAPARGRVVFDHVNFSYNPDEPLIKDLSLTAEPGETVAIVGPTGAGKTTLVNLLMRFYEIDSGKITVDGVDTSELTRDDLRRQFGMVLQDAWLFGGTIRENLAYGKLGATEEEILQAAEATHVDHFVRSLPDGYDTVLTDDGGGLSQGQRQLMTIARAWIANPGILILDEATSSVDTRTEVLIRQAMNRLRSGRTSFVIAHRLSTIRDADLILVMDDGRILEQGTHAELIEAKTFYYDLYMSQFGDPLFEEASTA